MEFKEITDLELLSSALKNYISNAEIALKELTGSSLPKSMIEGLEKDIFRGKEILENLNNELNINMYKKVKKLIADDNFVTISFNR